MNSYARDIRFNSLTTKDGLAQGRVLTILQDRKGFVWFGSYEGVSRYDGYNFKLFKEDQDNSQSISGSKFIKIIEDDDGILWIAAKQILNRFDPETEIFTSALKFSDQLINTIALDKSGEIYIGTNKGLTIFEPISEKVFQHRHDPDRQHSLKPGEIFDNYFDRNDKVWLAGSGGLSQFVRNKGHYNK